MHKNTEGAQTVIIRGIAGTSPWIRPRCEDDGTLLGVFYAPGQKRAKTKAGLVKQIGVAFLQMHEIVVLIEEWFVTCGAEPGRIAIASPPSPSGTLSRSGRGRKGPRVPRGRARFYSRGRNSVLIGWKLFR